MQFFFKIAGLSVAVINNANENFVWPFEKLPPVFFPYSPFRSRRLNNRNIHSNPSLRLRAQPKTS